MNFSCFFIDALIFNPVLSGLHASGKHAIVVWLTNRAKTILIEMWLALPLFLFLFHRHIVGATVQHKLTFYCQGPSPSICLFSDSLFTSKSQPSKHRNEPESRGIKVHIQLSKEHNFKLHPPNPDAGVLITSSVFLLFWGHGKKTFSQGVTNVSTSVDYMHLSTQHK